MNFVILFLFSTIVFTVNSESTKYNSHTVNEKNVGTVDNHDNGEKAYENKNERVSVSNSNGKKYHEDKSVDTHAKDIDEWIETLPQDQRYGARKAHAEWSRRAKGTETKLKGQLEAYSDILAEGAPLYLGLWIEDASTKLLASRIGKIRTYDEMVASVGVTADEIDRVTRKCIERAELKKDFKLSDTVRTKVTQEYVNWRYILSKLSNHTDVRVLKRLMKTYGIVNEEDLATEFAYLDVKTSVFIVHSGIPTDKINLKILLKGLKIYGWAYPNTRRAVTVLYKFVRGKTEDLN